MHAAAAAAAVLGVVQRKHCGGLAGSGICLRAWPAGWLAGWRAPQTPLPLLCPTISPLPQIYDYIDRHITKLDKDCKAFDAGKPPNLPARPPAWRSSSLLAAYLAVASQCVLCVVRSRCSTR